MTQPDWVIITAPTDRGADPRTELASALSILGRQHPTVQFRVAVLGGSGVTISAALDDALAAGAVEVVVISGQTLADRSMAAWFRRVIGHWLREHAENPSRPTVRIAGPLADGEGYAALIATALSTPAPVASTTTPPLTSPLWEQIPDFTRHVLVCRGPRCSARGAAETSGALSETLAARELSDDDVLVTLTGCLFPCGQAPVAVVYPDNVWYSSLSADRVATMVDEHLIGGTPVAAWEGARATGRE